jgi:hypothetical protein
MSRGMIIQTGAVKKGAAHRVLSEKVAAELARVPDAPKGMLRAINAARVGANKLIAAARAGDPVEIQISVSETPLGGWNALVGVAVEAPALPEE